MTYPQQPGGWHDPSWPGQQPYGDPVQYPASPAGYPASPAGYPAYGYGYGQPPIAPAPAPAPAPATNGMAIAALVVSLVAMVGLVCYFFGGLIGVVGAILGHVARRQIRENGQSGDGMALAGVIVGWVATALAVIGLIVIVGFGLWLYNNTPAYNPTPYNPTPYGT